MAAQGLIRARVVQQERRPNKRLFSLTDAGRRALHEFTASPPRPGAIREELMVQVQAVDAGDVQAVMAAIRERMTWAQSKIARFERLRARFLDGRTEDEHLATADRIGPYLTLMRGLAFERENLRWCQDTLAVLDRRTNSRVRAE
jgi:DNA-binding PadR family transcriptional regulator